MGEHRRTASQPRGACGQLPAWVARLPVWQDGDWGESLGAASWGPAGPWLPLGFAWHAVPGQPAIPQGATPHSRSIQWWAERAPCAGPGLPTHLALALPRLLLQPAWEAVRVASGQGQPSHEVSSGSGLAVMSSSAHSTPLPCHTWGHGLPAPPTAWAGKGRGGMEEEESVVGWSVRAAPSSSSPSPSFFVQPREWEV